MEKHENSIKCHLYEPQCFLPCIKEKMQLGTNLIYVQIQVYTDPVLCSCIFPVIQIVELRIYELRIFL